MAGVSSTVQSCFDREKEDAIFLRLAFLVQARL